MLEAGTVVGDRYRLKQRLGRNAGRQTWLAEDTQTEPQQAVVVKLLAFGGDVQWEDLKLFEREAQILKQLDHPQIPKYRDYFAIDDRNLWFGLVQEQIRGVSFKDLLQQGKRFTETEIRQIATEVLQILTYLHSLNPMILHRDIKPSNLIWGEDEQIYLVDFGSVSNSNVSEEATFTVVGTYGYTPLEQFGGRAVPASDLYALGISLIHLLTGITPANLPIRNLQIQFRDQININNRLADWLERITEPALEKRFQTAKQALETLEFGFDDHKLIEQVENFSSSLIDQTPQNRIQVHKTKGVLEVTIPIRQKAFFISQSPIFILITVLFFFSILIKSLFWALTAIAIYFFSEWNFRLFTPLSQKIEFSKQVFVVKSKHRRFLFKKTCKETILQNGLLRDIIDVSLITYQVSEGRERIKEVKILFEGNLRVLKQFSFGEGLSEQQLIWVTKEIRDWLTSHRTF